MRLYLFLAVLTCLACSAKVSAQLMADFTSNNQEGCDFAQINFSNLSTNNGIPINCQAGFSYSWNFNPGSAVPNTSTLCNPGNIFSNPGVYTICLTVTNLSNGQSDTECKTGFITIYDLPVASFTANPSVGCVPFEVCFQNTSTLSNGSFVNCLWDFGDGTAVNNCSNGPVCHTYTQVGNYTVSLSVTDANSCPTITASNILVANAPPTLNFVADATLGCSPPFEVNFSNLSSSSSNVSYSWIFQGADNPSFSGATPPPVTWSNPGTYDVTLIGLTDEGCADTLLFEDYITVREELTFSSSANTVCVGDVVDFSGQSVDAVNAWSWDFGDGQTSNEPDASHAYTATGCYFVTLEASKDDCIATVTSPICINVINPPAATMSNDNPFGCQLPHTVNFSSTGPAAASVFWEFGSPVLGTSTQANPTFTFTEYGVYPLTLTYTIGACDTIIRDTIIVQELQSSLSTSASDGCIPYNVQLGATVNLPNFLVTDWQWNIPGIGTFTGENPTATIADTGAFDIILQVTNSQGCIAIDTFPNHILAGEPQVVDFEASPLDTCIEAPISFTDLSGDFGTEWFWDFGDGGTSFEPEPSHVYSDTGFMEVCLTIFHYGCPNILCKPDYLYLRAPKARFTQALVDCTDPYTFQFNGNPLGADSIVWDFGVGTITTDTSTLEDPLYTYPAPGVYAATMEVYNFTEGCADTLVRNVVVVDVSPSFTLTDTIGCAPFTVNPVNTTLIAPASEQTRVDYLWTSVAGNISGADTPTPSITYNTPGIYSNDLQLVTTDRYGCMDTFVLDQDIYVNEIVADFSISQDNGCVPYTITLTDNSTNMFSTNVNWEWWNNEDGVVSNGPSNTANLTFNQAGIFDVRLRVTDALGCTDVLQYNDTILVTNPIALFAADTFLCTEQVVAFTNLSASTNATYTWDFGDGNTDATASPTHFYTTEGSYDVCLTVTEDNGCDSTYCQSITVADPVANFVADTTISQCPPLLVSFTNLSQNSISNGYIWDFGDNTGFSSGTNPLHNYTLPGIFDVTLISTNPSGCRDTLVLEDYIDISGPLGTFAFGPLEGCAPLEVTFVTTSELPSLHIMDYGDGSIDSSTTFTVLDTFVHTYTSQGEFQPELILQDSLGCSLSFSSDSTVRVEILDIEFAAAITNICDGGITNFANMVNSSLPITSLEWTFEGQNPPTSTAQNPQGIAYNNVGAYDVSLAVSNGLCTDTLVKPIYITVEATPVAAISVAEDTLCDGSTFFFMDASTLSEGSIDSWEWNFGDGNVSDLPNPSHVFPGPGDYQVTLTVYTSIGCLDTETISVHVNQNPAIVINPVFPICVGDDMPISTQLSTNPTGTETYVWDNASTLSCSDCPNPIATPAVTTTYSVTVTSVAGCIDVAQVTIQVSQFPTPQIDLNIDTTICEGTTILLEAHGGTSAPDSYQWDTSSEGLSCYNCANPLATPTAETTYTVTVTGFGGCVGVDSVTVTVFDPNQDFLLGDEHICEGGTVTLSDGNFGANPAWSPAEGLSCTFCPNPVASPDDTTTYTVTVEAPGSGCLVSDTLTVFVIPTDAVDAGEADLVCSGDPFQLNGEGFGTLTWAPAAVMNDPSLPNPTAAVDTTTTFYLEASIGNCTLLDSVMITVVDSIVVMASDATVCIGDSTQLVATGGFDSYTWFPETGLESPDSSVTVVNANATTTYTVTASLGTCPPSTDEATVIVNELPTPSIYPFHNFYINDPIIMEVEVPAGGNYAYNWSPSDGLSCADCPAPTALPDTSMTYFITVTDLATGCEAIISTELIEIEICEENVLLVPNAFTPNGDGINDVLYVRSTAVGDIVAFRIFDKWGSLVFESSSLNDGWDGLYDGKPVNPGVFVYYVDAICPLDGSRILKKGNVTVLR